MSTFAQRLEKLSKDLPRGWQAKLARHCKVKPPSVSDWLSGKTKNLEWENMSLCADFFNVSPHWLANFATTEEFVKKAPAQNIRVYVAEPEAKCYQVFFEMWELAKQQQVFQGVVGNIAVAIVTYIVAKAADRNSEMKHLAQALQTALSQNGQRDQAVLEKLMSTIEKMADALRPAARQAVAPIGESCATVRIGGDHGITLNKQDKDSIIAQSPTHITTERRWKAVITELDRENKTGKVRLDGDDDTRVSIAITDPAFLFADSIYLSAFVESRQVTLTGKAELSEGDIKRLYVSDAE